MSDKPRTIGWVVSEIYGMVQRIDRRLARLATDEPMEMQSSMDGGNVAEARRLTVGEQRHERDRNAIADMEAEITALRAKLAETVHVPNLGMASTEQLMREVITRFRLDTYISGSETWHASVERALVLAEMLGSMGATDREYRPVDHG